MIDASPHIYLASRSPRRAELLGQIGVRFEVVAADTDETPRAGESADAYVRRVAADKALAGSQDPSCTRRLPVLGADTAVVVDGCILGKPRGRDEALSMLRALSGREHRVLTAVSVRGQGRSLAAVSESRVTFRSIGETELLSYWDSGEPGDKAGGYGIQGLGALFVERLDGSYSGVMGLPLFETGRLLEEVGVRLLRGRGS